MMPCRLWIVLVLYLSIVNVLASSITTTANSGVCSSWQQNTRSLLGSTTTSWFELRGGDGASNEQQEEGTDVETDDNEASPAATEQSIVMGDSITPEVQQQEDPPENEEEEPAAGATASTPVDLKEEASDATDSSTSIVNDEEITSSSSEEQDDSSIQNSSDQEAVERQQQEEGKDVQVGSDDHSVADEEEETLEGQQGEFSKENAQQLRLQGKDLYDDGDYEKAAETFRQASLVLSSSDVSADNMDEYATCRLHEALCRLKQDNYDACIDVCTELLNLEAQVSAAIQARAHHRRAKAKLALEDSAGALQDARSAAFLGDRKAVALYGRLMRENSGSSGSDFDDEGNAEAPALLNDLFQGRNPFLPGSSETSSSDSSAALMESLLNKSSPTSSSSNSNNPFGMLGDMSSMLGKKNPLLGNKGNGGGGSLAKSIMTSLGKRLEDQSTQDRICNYLQNTDTPQVQQLASMAGMPLSDKQASKLVSLCHAVTPKFLSKSVKNSKRLWYAVSILRKMMQLINKYKYIIVLWVLLAWIKSAIMRPIPLSKAEKRAIREAMKTGGAITM